ncbi:AAA domain-containing protein [Flavobacterium amniphilum]|uniref:AAA domain-containing protein n=1 Tax=Flavobacterium amniphilum TaxID=1834035 RepID=UPI00202A94F8|nr:AAA domain-containing protein [Flavobacterium amniphilum]MCL9806934.1 AAA domain-containing protein [Flavobacterium amniphilum]
MEYKKWITYWKKSLSDSLKADIDIDKLKHFEMENFEIENDFIFELQKINELIDFEETRINKKKGIINKQSENWVVLNEVEIVIAPIKIKPTTENLVFLKDPKPKYPFWFFAKLDRNGKLRIPEETFPVFQRKYLEPLADERTEFIFSSVEKIDLATAIGKEEFDNYAHYIKYLKKVFKFSIDQDIEEYFTQGYETISNAIILLPDEEMNAAIGIIQLYEKILKEKEIPKLLKSFITLKNGDVKTPVAVSDLIIPNSLHLGQMGFDFPLSISQRKSLYTHLESNEKVFAVNGPPGTGKTTLLQSLVGNKFVESAIIGLNAPVILACSTNNQAVTNIIDSFSKSNTKKGKLQGRWIPEIDGYATYLPANGKTEAELKGINYKKQNEEGLFSKIERQDFLQKAKIFFSEKAQAYHGVTSFSIKETTKKLQNEIIQIQSILKEASTIWNEYMKAEKVFSTDYLISNSEIEKYYKDSILNENSFKVDIENLKSIEERIINYFNKEPFFRKLLCFLGLKSALNNRASEIKIIIRDSLIEVINGFIFTKSSILEKVDAKIKMAETITDKIENWKNWKNQNAIYGNPPRTEEDYWEFELLKIRNDSEPNCFYDELDISFRHKAFQIALHYWEGRYLMQLESDLSDDNFTKKGLDAVKNRWRRQAMITPCFVSTFYMAPKFFSSFRFFKKGEDGKNIFDTPPLFDFIDLLIVDEAGQVSPEVGIATFALAKQAVIVGDVKQIEPVWNITNKIDVGNLKKCELIKSYDDLIYEKEFDPKGFLSSTGSIMKMAQNACNFKEKEIKEKGVLLVEHRRCYNEIINYCNVLAYNGQLIPLKGNAPKDLLFPPMYCIHIEGNSTTINTSRYNQNEVDAIVNWLSINRQSIEEKYGKLEKAIGIITPFTGQKNSLKYALKNAGFDIDILKIGTVHALQGAERPIVLFSMVYGDGDSGTLFFDRDNKPNMLNVAVSRAKDNFIVFANTRILDKKAKTPSGILANHLVYEK